MSFSKSSRILRLIIFIGAICASIFPQQPNPVDRQVANPITDTPNVNPVATEPEVKVPQKKKLPNEEGGDGDLVVYSEKNTTEGKEGNRIVTHSGAVDVRYGMYRLQADKVIVYEASNKLVAEGSVIFDQGNDQRITGRKAEWNYKTKLGYFVDSTGFTNQTNDGTIIYWTADRVERISLDEILILNGKFTACEDTVPKWSFTAKEARIKTNDKVKLKSAKFRVKDVPIVALPFASISIKKEDRQSGFLTPTFGYSGSKGVRLSTAYYKTLGRSADVTFRGELYSARGFGYGLDFRSRANSRSYFNAGFYAVEDRVLGSKPSAQNPDQGGSIVYAEGVHYFPNGFTASADVRITSSLAFRQVFSDGIQQSISPIEVSQGFVNKSWGSYTLNLLSKSQVITIPNVRIKTRNLPSINFEKRPSPLSFFKAAYFSFKTNLEGVSRVDDVDDVNLYRQTTGRDPIVSPALAQRLDFYPQITIPFYTKFINFTATAGGRVTYYSNSLDGVFKVIGKDLIRKYGEFELDVRPVALAKNFYNSKGGLRFRHSVEPYLTYRYVKGINNYNQIIRFDYADTMTDTNEIEYGLINKFFTRRYTEAVSDEAKKQYEENPASVKNPLSIQPYEIFTLTIRGKYFFDKTFGGALNTGFRNQIFPISSLTAFTFGGVPRRFSPINIDATYRPERTIFINSRMDVGVQGDGLRDISATVGYDSKLFKMFQTFYYTRAVTLIPSLQQYADAFGKEPGTLRGSQWSPSVFLGDRNKGFFGGASLFFDFQNRRAQKDKPLISSLFTFGYAYDCCSFAIQAYTYNVGLRRENRYVFSFKLNGIGAFGTEQFGQGLR
ncbi:MAG TPA: LPS assembly protein LptD [Pyrinomonadaceae bacterium]|nr:LPS assembly protein LptD [Pyrinomonadaceae bacterium]